jgi:hypothetical protein
MTYQTYTLTLTDLGTYTVSVIAETPEEAARIATSVLHEEATVLPDGMTISDRKTDVAASVAENQPTQMYRVSSTYELDFSMTFPARSRAEAVAAARRLYDESCGPFEFNHDDDRVRPFCAREVPS